MNAVKRQQLDEGDDQSEKLTALRDKILWRRYVLAVLLAILAFGIRYQLGSVLGDELPFMLFIAAALGAAWYGGAVAGFITLVLGLVLGEYFYHLPRGTGANVDSIEIFRFLRYIFTGAVGVIIIEMLHRGERRARATAEKLKLEVERRKCSEAALQQAKNLLDQHAKELERRIDERTRELSASVESLEDILYHIAHNFRAPGRGMAGFIALLERDYGQNWDATAHDYASRISTSAKQMERLIQDLLDYGRLTQANVRLTNVSLGEAVNHALLKLSDRIQNQNAEIKVDYPLPEVRADRDLLDQVVVQLLDNAVKFVPSGTLPRIQIGVEIRDDIVRLWIQDNGIGLDPRYQDRIFLPFERQKVVEGYEGNGIGLAVVKEAVQRMGGRTGAESQAGAGSRFWIELPVAAPVKISPRQSPSCAGKIESSAFRGE